MVKYIKREVFDDPRFSPLLILFMVKYTYHRVRIFQGFCEILGKNIRFFAILMAKELTRD